MIRIPGFIPAVYKEQIHQGSYFYTQDDREDQLHYLASTQRRKGILDLLITVMASDTFALSIISVLNPDAIRRAVFHDQAEIFIRVPGIGQKTAQKIVFHLKDRMPSIEGLAPLSMLSETDTEVIAALTALGYSVIEAQSALQSFPSGTPNDVEARLRLALQYFSR
jgi:Holliday junction DNA helicase RuvA